MDTTSKKTLFPRPHTATARACGALLLALLATPVFASDGRAKPVDAVETSASTSPGSQDSLAPGKYEWTPEASATGDVVVVVSLPEQMAHVYRGGVRIGRSSISSGKAGNDTPPGVFEILEKRKVHFSNLYNNAPMPFMQRLTWDGIALHAGQIPGYPASHGCVRLPKAFAEQLFQVTERGGMVVVADATTHSMAVLRPGARVPVDPWTGREPGRNDDVASTSGTSGTRALAGK